MKKITFLLVGVVVAAAIYFGINSMSVGIDSSLMMQNIEALAAGEGGGGGRCPSGGMANTKCPIWSISYQQGGSWPTITCNTGGSYKCVDGKCPHGR